MNKAENLIEKICQHKQLGKVKVTKALTRVKVEVKILDRGIGWNPISETYKGIKTSTGWYRGENKQYGELDECHIKTLNILKEKIKLKQ